MTKKFRRTISGLTALLCLFGTVACSSGGKDPDSETSTGGESVTDSTAVESEELKPDLPEKNFGGREFRVGYHTQDNTASLLFTETDTGDVVESALYKRNSALEETYGINLNFVNSGLSAGDFSQHVNTSVLANEDLYDICIGNGIYFVKYLAASPYVDYNDIPYIELEKPWWNSEAFADMTVCGKTYLYSPMITHQSVSNTQVLVTNLGIMESNNIEMPYETVKSGKWTLDKFMNMVKDVYVDVNGNTVKDDEDTFGFTCYAQREPWGCSLGIDIIGEKDGELEIIVDTKRTADIIDKMYSLYFEQPGTYVTSDYEIKGKVQGDYHRGLFANGRVMMSDMEIKFIGTELRYSDVDYGILPTPKYDENQEHYYSSGGGQIVVIPKTNPDLEFTGVILDAMCYETYKRVIPAYYELALKEKFLRNEDDKAMIDLISDSTIVWAPYVYRDYTGLGGIVDTLMQNKVKDFASWYASMKPGADKMIKVLQEMMTNNE